MKQTLRHLCVALALAAGISPLSAEEVFLETGKRILVKTEGRKDYWPRIVACDKSDIGLCIRDTDGNPPNNPLSVHADGLTVHFAAWDVTYIIHSDGTGRTFVAGKEVKPFTWTMIPE